MHREGLGIILAFFSAAVVMTLIVLASGGGVSLNVLLVFLWLLTLFSIYFFRDPNRAIPDNENAILSPADGKVIEISEADEPEYLKTKTRKISVFLNVFDVHVNRCPIGGEVKFFRYQKGRFLRAYLKEASYKNEQTIIGISQGKRQVVFKQIAGLIARRISCDLREGHKVKTGERMGIIKFGSRVDVFMPLDVEVKVVIGDRVAGGVSILGVFQDVS
ncbi:MAG: phosphatidylserine decarboxylase family protein [bacterium]